MNSLRCSLTLVLLFPLALAAGQDKPTKATTRAADGVNIVYETSGKGDTALVLLHGWCSTKEAWKNQVDEFAKDYRIVAIDLGGHGESGKERKEWTTKSLAEDAEAVIKALGLKRVILVGHSMGGPIALGVAKKLPGVVVGVIGVDTLQNADNKFPEELAKQLQTAMEADFKGFLTNTMAGMFPEKADPALVKSISDKAQAQDPKMATALFRDFPRHDMPALLKEAKVPIRCINSGGGFQFFTPTDSEINKKYADYQAVIIPDVGHFPHVEKPKEFNAKLREVLKEFAAKK